MVIYSPNEFAGCFMSEIVRERPLNQFIVFEKCLLCYFQAYAFQKLNSVNQ